MIQLSLPQIATILELSSPPSSASCHGISIDTRTLQPGNLFIAITGEHHDGHAFIEDARQKGAIAAIVSRQIDSPLTQLVVADTTAALGQIATAWRHQFNIPIIAVTGSNGKTTLKNMLAAILGAACHGDNTRVLATQGTLNNHWGLPLTLAALNATHRYAVIEMGMNHFGEIDYLTKLTQPHVAVITNAAACHLEGVGNIAGVARAKAEIFAGLNKNGIAILNRDDDFFAYWQKIIANKTCLTFGFHPEADVRATLQETALTPCMTLHTPKGEVHLQLPLLGKHNVLNALAATAAALAIDIPLAAIKAGLESIQPAPGRLQLHTLNNGVKIIDDTYNANPFSLQAAVNTLANFAGKKILVLGDMKELGPEAKSIHQAMAEAIRQAGIDFLFTYGELSATTAQAFGEGAYHFSEQEKLVNALKPFLYNQTTILIKGSRSMKMEKVIAGLMGT
ncbi:MAG: UDP-N-acetylmuramoyl-tripeptide--D-alanyl-D-alanine ligase [Gammaproteobacteria bacterium]|nr:UDP-N-acetylmuramoyl-tripeptide--D-alanyl-D-alanine ligase [Gammaproteobacteria bacterium]